MPKSIIITRPVVVKIRVTERYKTALLQQIEYSVRRLDLELQRLERPGASQLADERQKRLEVRQKLVEQAQGVRRLQPGDEVLHGRVESLVRLAVGDDWQSVMGLEVLLEDGRVVDIRTPAGGPGNE
ncbi:MAG: YlqD family protein [Bacillota bacterium]